MRRGWTRAGLIAVLCVLAVAIGAGAASVAAVEPGEVWDEEIIGEEFEDRMQGMTDDYVVLASADSDAVYVLNRTDGSVEDTVTIAGARSVAGDEDTAYVGVDGGDVIAIDPSDGTQLWSESVHSDGTYGQIAYKDGVLVSSAPADGYVVRLDPSDGSALWSTDIGGNVRADTDGESVVVGIAGLGSETVHVLEPSDGSTRFTFSRPDGINGNDVAVGDGVAISVSSLAGSTYAFDTDSGSTLWSQSEDGNRVVADGSSDIALIAEGDNVHVRGLSSGSSHGTYSPGSTGFTFAVDDGMSVWAGTGSGEHFGRYFGEAQLSNFDPTSGVHETPIELSVDVLSRSDVTVDFYDADDDSLIASESTNGAETVTTQWEPDDPVEVSWYVEVGNVQSDTFEINPPPPELSNPSPSGGEIIDSPPAQLSVDVEAGDFDEEGYTAELEWILNGDVVGSETIDERGTYAESFSEIQTGENTWSAEITDQYGQTATTGTQTFNAPNNITIRDYETNELITGSENEVEIRFFEDGGEITDTRTTTDGIVSMDNLPANTEYVITVRSDEYETARVVLPNIIDQQTVWLLNESADIVFNSFELQDDTGAFPAGDTKLLIEAPRPDSEGESESYVQISGDYFGAGQSFETALFRGERYRLVIENRDGERRSLGSYVAEADGPVNVGVGSVTWPYAEDNTYRINTNLVEENGQQNIRVQFTDPVDRTTSLHVRVEDRFNASHVIYEETVYGPTQYQAMIPLTEEQAAQQWAVNYTVHQNPTNTGRIPVAGDSALPIPFDPYWLGIFSMIGIVVIAAAYPGPLSAIGGVVVVAMAGIGVLIGWLQIPILTLFIAGTIAVFGLVRSNGGIR